MQIGRYPITLIISLTVLSAYSSEYSLKDYLPSPQETQKRICLRHEYPITQSDTTITVTDSTFTTKAYVPAIDKADFDSIISIPARQYKTLPDGYYSNKIVFDTYHFLNPLPLKVQKRPYGFDEYFSWIDDLETSNNLILHARQRYSIEQPLNVKYNLSTLPEPPKMYHAFVDPTTTKIRIEEIKVNQGELAKELDVDIESKKWLHNFDASLQFSQAYVSPNWYQGGNKNLNMIVQAIYNVKLNPKFYPRYLFEATMQYKLGLYSSPDDTIHAYNISEDVLQLNATAGLKAAKNWFYSANMQFKTQLLNNYPTNSREMQAAFLSPGELNVGLGMTYSYTNPRKTLSLGLSISPLSWNLKTCTNSKIDETAYGITEGRRTENEIGSNLECNLQWKIMYNIIYTSRLFVFTDYDYLQSDWENTISFNINRFLSTKIYVHVRYDSSTPPCIDSSWHKLQLKEIFSFGFSYKISNT